MTQESLLSDDLLRQLVAVGQVDILVGLPTLNHASTVPDIVRAVHASFSTYFPRQRTLLLNSDGGSDDNTPALVRDCCLDESGTVTVSHSLRTSHRISTPYHGMPGKANALRRIFAVSDLLSAGVVVVLDPEVVSLTPAWVAALARPIRDQQCDFVAPVYPRHHAGGLLVTQLLRPLIRAGYGRRVREPLAGEFGCSSKFAAYCVEQPVWDSDLTQNSVDLWLTGTALAGPFRTCQAWLGPRVLATGLHRPGLAEVFKQIVGSALQTLDTHADYWLPRTGSEDVPLLGTTLGVPEDTSPQDGVPLAKSFSRDVRDLNEVLRAILTPETLAAVAASAENADGPRYPDELWAATVYEFLVAYHHSVMRRDHITQALLPLYLARSGTFLIEHAASVPDAVNEALESLCVQFERSKGSAVERWNQTT